MCHKENCKEQERKTSELKNKKDEIVSKIKDYIKEDIEILAPYYSNEVCYDRYGNELKDKGRLFWHNKMLDYIYSELAKSLEIAKALKRSGIKTNANNDLELIFCDITDNGVTLTLSEIMDIINIIVVEALETKRR